MRFYRIHLRNGDGESCGFEHYTNIQSAKGRVGEWMHDGDATGRDAEIKLIEIEPTKHGILDALNQYAGHPDNGGPST